MASKTNEKIVEFNTLDSDCQELITKARVAMDFSYSPFSQFKVGAAIRCVNGEIFTGCNVENSSFTPTICAERTAIVKAVSEGFQQFIAVAVVANQVQDEFTAPCGVCRQTICEFARNIPIYLSNPSLKQVLVTSMPEILPYAFSLNNN